MESVDLHLSARHARLASSGGPVASCLEASAGLRVANKFAGSEVTVYSVADVSTDLPDAVVRT